MGQPASKGGPRGWEAPSLLGSVARGWRCLSAPAVTRLPWSRAVITGLLLYTRPRGHKQTSSSVKFPCHLADLRALCSRERAHLSAHTDPLPKMLSLSENLCFCPRHSNHPHSQTSSPSNSQVIYSHPPFGDSHNTPPRATCHFPSRSSGAGCSQVTSHIFLSCVTSPDS